MKKLLVLLIVGLMLTSTNAQGYAISGSFTDLSNGQVSYSSYEGKLLFIEAMQTDCVYCDDPVHRSDINYLNSQYNQEIEFFIISVFGNDDVNDVQNFVNEHSIEFNAGVDSGDFLRTTYQVGGTPTYVVLDEDGDLLQRWVGNVPLQSMIDYLNTLVDNPITEDRTTTEDNGGPSGSGNGESILSQIFGSPIFQFGLVIFLAITIFFRSFGSKGAEEVAEEATKKE